MGPQPTINPPLATSTAIISAPLALTACAAMAVSYVATLYAPSLLRLPPPTSLQNYMLRRFACAAVSSTVSVVLTASLFGWRAVVFPLLLTSLIYAGSIVSKIFLMIRYRRRVGLTCCSWDFKEQIHALVFNVMAWRNYVVTISVGRRRFGANLQLVFRLIKFIIFLTFASILITLIALPQVHMTLQDIIVCFLAFMPTGWGILLIAQALKPLFHKAGLWGSIKALARGYEIIMGLLLFTPIAFLAWFPFVSEFQTRMLFNQAFSRGLQISRILGGGGQKKDRSSRNSKD